MRESEAEGYIDTNAHLRARVSELERELTEQCRLLAQWASNK